MPGSGAFPSRSAAGPRDAPKVRVGISGRRYEPWRDLFCSFDNTGVTLRAPADARGLMERLGLARAYDAAALVELLRRRNGR